MYGKIFEQIYDGTLVENWQALVTFQQMIILCDDCGILDLTPSAISRRTGIPLEHIQEGISFLEEDDPHSRTQGDNGKRIVRIDNHRPWGWKIVNHAKYKKMASYEDKKRLDRERIASKRSESQDVADSRLVSTNVVNVAHTNTDTYTDKQKHCAKPSKKPPAKKAKPENHHYETRKKKLLVGTALTTFNEFWRNFDFKRGKAEAADAWLETTKPLDDFTLKAIYKAAASECKNRPELIKAGQTPKMAEGWIRGRRWEDELKSTLKSGFNEPTYAKIPKCQACGMQADNIERGRNCPFCNEMVTK